jgi:hypothetical protein
MKVRKLVKTPYSAALLALVSLGWCWLLFSSMFFWLGIAGLCVAGWRGYKLFHKQRGRWRRTSGAPAKPAAPAVEEPAPRPRRQTAQELGSLVEQMISDGRYALLLRPQIAKDLTPDQFRQAYSMKTWRWSPLAKSALNWPISTISRRLKSTTSFTKL